METPVPNFYFMGVQFFHLLALAVWVGGLVIIRCIVLPTLIRFSPLLPSSDPVLLEIFRKFYSTMRVCAGVLVVTSVIKFLTWENLTPWNTMRYSAIFVMVCISLYMSYGVFPQTDQAVSSLSQPLSGNTKQSQSMMLNPLSNRADYLMMGGFVCGLTAILMA